MSTTQTSEPTTAEKRPPEPSGCPMAPGPRGNWALGHMVEYKRDPVGLSVRVARRYPGVARLRIGPYTVNQVTDPDLIEQVLQTNARSYTRGRFYEAFKLFMGKGLLTMDDDEWREQRRIVRPAFAPKVIDAQTDVIASSTASLLDGWQKYAHERREVDIVPEMMNLTLAVLGRTLLGRDISHRMPEVSAAVKFALAAIIQEITSFRRFVPRWVPTPHNRRLREALRTLDSVVDEVLEARRTRPSGGDDLVGLLLDAGLERREIRDALMTIFLAGHETTGVALSWTLYALAQHPQERARLEAEVDEVLGDRTPTLADLDRLRYTRMVVQESMRVYPPIWQYPRDVAEDDVLRGYRVPAGSSVFISVYATHRNRDHWDNPEAFNPERFAEGEESARHKYAYLPFGGGRRICIGMRLALLQLHIATAMVAQRYRMSAVSGHPVRHGALLSLHPTDGCLMMVEERRRDR